MTEEPYLYNLVFNGEPYLFNLVFNEEIYLYNLVFNEEPYLYNLVFNGEPYLYNLVFNEETISSCRAVHSYCRYSSFADLNKETKYTLQIYHTLY